MRVLVVLWLLLLVVPVCVEAGEVNELTAEERMAGFEGLFNGKNLSGWEHHGNWSMEGGVISREGGGGSLVFVRKTIPNDFELKFQWKVGKGSNSGVYYRPGQYECQILHDPLHTDGKNPRTSAASLYFCMAPAHDATKPAQQ